MRRKCLCVALAVSCVINVSLAQVRLQDKVVDGSSEPIPGANTRASESLNGATTDAGGKFELNLPDGNHRIRVTYLDYEQGVYQTDHSGKDAVIKLKEKYVNIDQVMVTGIGSHRRTSNPPIPMKVLTGKDLKKASVTNLQDAMTKLNPSIVFMENGQGTTMNMNGLTEKYVVILENSKCLVGDDTYPRIDMSNTKRIEILDGAASVLYSSDAIAGVVNIITDDSCNKVNVTSNNRYGSKNQFLQLVNADVNVGKFGSYISYQYQQADGWQLNPYTESKDELVPTNKRASEGLHRSVVNQRFTYNATDRLSLYVRGTFFGRSSDRPMPTDKVNTTNYDMRRETSTYGAGTQHMINKNSYLNTDCLSDNHSTYKDFFDGKKSGESDMTKRIHYHNLNVKGIFRLGKYNKLSTGVEFIKELLSSETDNITGKNMYTAAFYAQDEININKHFQAYAGLCYTYHENFKSYATPNVTLLYKVGGFNFRGSYAADFRIPELKELYTESEKKASGVTRPTVGSPGLDPEKSDNFTLSAEYTIGFLSLSVSAFMNNVRSLINYKISDTVKRDAYNAAHGTDYDEIQMRANIDKAKIKGINMAFNSCLGVSLTLNGDYSFMDGKDVYEDELLDKTVKHSSTVAAMRSYTWNKYKLNVNFNGRIQGERHSTSHGYAPKYSLWNLNMSHTFRAGDSLLEPGVDIKNLFDYADDRPFNCNYATLAPGRTYYVSLLVRFKQ